MTATPSWFGSPAEEAHAVRTAAARVGATVEAMAVQKTAFGLRAVGRVMCVDGWHAARLLLALAIEDSMSPGARDLALWLRASAPSDEAFARAVHAFVKKRVRFVREAGEVFQGPGYSLAAGAGDCDDHFRIVYALAIAGGIPAALGVLHRGDDAPPQERGPAHVVAQLCPAGACAWAETTVDAAYGEHPLDAAVRTGVIKGRPDLAPEAVIMTEKDLVPVPVGFRERNAPAQTALDAAALVRLSSLPSAFFATGSPTDPTDVTFRQAVLAFQVATGLAPDGLIGHDTRHVMGAALGPDGFRADYERTIGDIAAASPAQLTAHLDDNFFRALAQMVSDFQARGAAVTAQDFLAGWLIESGVHPTAKNSLGFAGINQMGNSQRAAVGFHGTINDYIAMSAGAQMPFIRRYYEGAVRDFAGGNYGMLTDAGALYLLNFEPAKIGHAGDGAFVLATRTPGDDGSAAWRQAHPGDVYANNAGLDVGGKGAITVGDMTAKTAAALSANKAYVAALLGRLAAVNGVPPTKPEGGSAGPAVAGIAVAGAAAALGYVALSKQR